MILHFVLQSAAKAGGRGAAPKSGGRAVARSRGGAVGRGRGRGGGGGGGRGKGSTESPGTKRPSKGAAVSFIHIIANFCLSMLIKKPS